MSAKIIKLKSSTYDIENIINGWPVVIFNKNEKYNHCVNIFIDEKITKRQLIDGILYEKSLEDAIANNQSDKIFIIEQ